MEWRDLRKAIKRGLWRIPAILSPGPRTGPGLPLDFAAIRSILVIRPDRLGDVILSTPVYESLKRSFPATEVAVLANRAAAGILTGNPFVDRVLPFDKKRPLGLWGDLRRGKFDLAIVLNRTFSATAAVLALLSGARYRAGYHTPEGRWVYNIAIEGGTRPQHEIQNNLDILRALGTPEIRDVPRIEFDAAEKKKIDALIAEFNRYPDRPLVLVKPGTRVAKWGWRPEKFRAVCYRLLDAKKAEVFVIRGPGEETLLNSLFPKDPQAPIILPELPVKELALLIQRSSLLFCNHTGIMHMASATQTPAAVIFKHGEIARWGPCHTRFAVLEERGEDGLRPEEALAAIDRLLNAS